MDNVDTCSLVNSLLVEVHRSLLQYAAEASPWASAADTETQSLLLSLASEQEKSVGAMVDFLQSRKFRIDFGLYPQEYTSLHFVGIGYILERLKESERSLVSQLQIAVGQLEDNPSAHQLLETVLQRDSSILGALDSIQLAAQA